MLREYKNDMFHYFYDEDDRWQGECKRWYSNGQLCVHSFYVDGMNHGESKTWNVDGQLYDHCFYVNGEVYRDLLKDPVDDEEKFMITLETGGGWLC
jgi:antitoxin component YwqK of YwqJK toxin-antitoxin module